ncbi:hypothetical protein L2E82_13253 [Cichorium intybus]|uniref:Uncharacterized protein n=1 Tax=Cichorium intybus TaxID=13427 RepID=A0ACB9GHT0_CICIN|nr:hypothetical protein L2E82_13253 [Cichorium intybus]
MLEAYADIVFRAWKAAEGESQEEIENDFLQTLVDGSIHASTTSCAASIRRILGGIITQRTTDGVEKLIFNLTEPVIFRSLQTQMFVKTHCTYSSTPSSSFLSFVVTGEPIDHFLNFNRYSRSHKSPLLASPIKVSSHRTEFLLFTIHVIL